MDLSRRRILKAALLAAAAGATAGCASTGSGARSGSPTGDLTLWYWGGGLSDKVVADAAKHFPGDGLTSAQIGGAFKQKLLVTMIANKYVPDITGVKGEDMPYFLPDADHFIDLNTLGARKLAPQFLSWKWKQGTTEDGRLIGFPIDIGPTALYYRADLFAKAGLPSDPAAVAAAAPTLDDYFALGAELRKALPKSFLVNNIGSIFTLRLGQLTKRFIDQDNRFIGDQDHIREAWTTAVKPFRLGIDAGINDSSWNAAIGNGTLTTEVGAAWHAADIEQAAPNTKGRWRVAPTPGGPANNGGSFLALPKSCRNPELAFQMITWMLDAANQGRNFTDAQLFPTMPAAYALPALTAPDPYFGGQRTIDVFGPAAKNIPFAYTAPADNAVSAPYYSELTNIEAIGKDPDAAWRDAVQSARLIAEQQGVN